MEGPTPFPPPFPHLISSGERGEGSNYVKSPKTKTLDGLIKRTSSMLDGIESKTVHKGKEGDKYRKKK